MEHTATFLQTLDAVIEKKKMLTHPFYRAWSTGALSRTALSGYARQYYHFVNAFPTFLSATHSNTPRLGVRQEILENLIEEERGTDNHPDLWARFAGALGISRPELEATDLLPETKESIGALRSLTRDGSFLEGVAALYAYESQIPEVASVKIDGLRRFYGITDGTALSFFTVHQEADVHHSRSERAILANNAVDPEDRDACIAAAETAAQSLLTLLDGVYRVHVQPSVARSGTPASKP